MSDGNADRSHTIARCTSSGSLRAPRRSWSATSRTAALTAGAASLPVANCHCAEKAQGLDAIGVVGRYGMAPISGTASTVAL